MKELPACWVSAENRRLQYFFIFVLGGPTAPTGVERRSSGSPGTGSGKVEGVGLRLGLELGLALELTRGLVAEFLTVIFL